MIKKVHEKEIIDLTVIITFFNEGELILNAVRSCAYLGVDSLEILIINDGSDQDLIGILSPIISDNKKVTIFHQSNQGVSAARNKGIELAHGRYFTFLDADDEFEPCNLIPIISSQDQVIRLGFIEIRPDIDPIISTHAAESTSGKRYLKHAIMKNIFQPTACGYLFNSEWVKEVGQKFHEKLSHSEDTLFTMEALIKASKVSASPINVYRYNRRIESATTANNRKNILKRLTSNQIFLRRLSKLYRQHRDISLDKYISNDWNHMHKVSLRINSRQCRLLALQSQIELLAFCYPYTRDMRLLIKELRKALLCFKSTINTRYTTDELD